MPPQNESGSPALEAKIVAVLKNHPSGTNQKGIQESIPNLSAAELVQVLNKFINQDKIELLRKGNQLVYALKDQNTAKQPQTDVEEKLIYEAIKRSGNNGISPKELKFACNLPQPQVTKLLKAMEAKRLVKSVVSASKKKVFILFGLEPSQAVTGGTFYNGQEFETEFVDVLCDQSYKYLLQVKGIAEKQSDPISRRHASVRSSKDVCDYINSLKISKVELKLSDIEKILETLVYDDKIEASAALVNSSSNNSENYYRVKKPLIPSAGLMRMPCGVCQIYRDCGKNRVVSPSTCVYMKQWLEF